MRRRGRKSRCLYCRSSRTIAKGSRKTATLGERRLRVCKDCRRKFTVGRKAPQMQAIENDAGETHAAPDTAVSGA